ncbi:MAG TPA: LamG-like jellyroll fold domain-containing protein [Candidatus Limnocylindria bacterium]|nr:LamG-like jellyroll fold domain-containing protein [Candidatus Limnocylindria bacterium]
MKNKLGAAILTAGAAAASCLMMGSALADVTAQGWWHYGEIADLYGDSSGLGHRFSQAFSCVGSGQSGAIVSSIGVGGPLGPTGYISTSSLRWGANNCNAAGMWAPGFNPPATNYGIELWVLPTDTGVLGGNSTWIFGTGSSGGVSFRLTLNPDDGTSSIAAVIIGSNKQIGDSVPIDTTRWTHLAIVNANGTSTFYVDGTAHGAPDVGGATVSAGDIFAGSSPGTQPTFNGNLDELRIFTFAAGQFSTNDLLLRVPGPNIVTQPQSAAVWDGGAAPFEVAAALDASTTYQWQKGTDPIPGATGSEYYLPIVTGADSGSTYSVVLNNSTGISLVSSNAVLSVVPVQTGNVSFYRDAVQGESGLVAYFPADGNSGASLSNLKEPAASGTLEGGAEFDGRTNRSFGERAIRLKGDGDVTIPANSNYEFAGGKGTIEALVYLDRASAPDNETIFSLAASSDTVYYQILASPDGSSLIYKNDSLTQPLTWAVPVSLLGRLAHVAVVFSTNTVTAYVDGLSLGTKPHPSFGLTPGLPANIGSAGLASPGRWTGTIDELAVYDDALSANTIAVHNSRFVYGTNVTAPTIVSQPTGTKTLLAGGTPTFVVSASGTAPLNYQWKFKGQPIAGATLSTLTLPQTTVASSGAYSVTVSNPIGATNSVDFTLNFVAPTGRYATMVMTDNPSAFWRLDETNGTTAFDLAGGHDGVYSGALTLGAPGALPGDNDTAVSFGGADGVAKVPYSQTLNPGTAFTVEFWANPKDHDVNTYVPMGSQFRNGAGRLGWAFYIQNNSPNGWEIQLGDATGVHADAYSSDHPAVAGRYDHIVAVWDGVNIAQLYVNGALDATATGSYVPNGNQPWVIGQRNDGNFGFNGSIDEVAFYNYALTPAQIVNHFSVAYVAAHVVADPTNIVNALEASTITLTTAVTGYPNTYQWFKDGAAIDPTAALNPDGSAHYPQGVTSTNLVITQITPADAGQYHLEVTNPLAGATSANATVTVKLDTTPPAVAYVTAESTTNRVRVVFNRPVTPDTAGVAANYTFSGGVTAASVTLTTDPAVVGVVTSGLLPGQAYTLSVSGVKDTRVSGNTIGNNSTPFTSYVRTPGLLAWDFYAKINGTSVDDLLGDPQYPNGVYTNSFLTNFNTSLITGSDLAGNPAFGPLGDNYGAHIYGWLTPTTGGSYTFFLHSDDASQLWLSTDENPANVVEVAYEAGCCTPFTEPGDTVTQTSAPVPLQAGKSYYIEVFHKEGGGGDLAEVAWRIAGDNTAAGALTPIPGSFLSTFAPVPTQAAKFNLPTLAGGNVTLTWSGTGTLEESTDLATWTPVAGNPASGYSVAVSTASQKFYRLVQ